MICRVVCYLSLLGVLASAVPASAFDGIRLTVLASGNDSGAGPSMLVEAGDEVLLFDCGRSTVERLGKAGVPLRDLTAVFLTSLDGEHVAGCAELLNARGALRSVPPLAVWGPAGTVEIAAKWVVDSATPAQGHDIAENVVYRTDEVTVTAFVTDYPAQTQSFGYRVDRRGRAIALSGRTRYSQDVIRYARNVQILVHEVVLASEQSAANEHARGVLADYASPEDAGKVFRAARPYLAVYTHVRLHGASPADLVQRTRRYYRGPLEIARDLMIVEVQNEVQLRGSPSDGRRDRSAE